MAGSAIENKSSMAAAAAGCPPDECIVILSSSNKNGGSKISGSKISGTKFGGGNYHTHRDYVTNNLSRGKKMVGVDDENYCMEETIDNTSFSTKRRRHNGLLSTHAFISNDHSVDVQNQYYKMREPEGSASLTRQTNHDDDPANIMDTKSQNLTNEEA